MNIKRHYKKIISIILILSILITNLAGCGKSNQDTIQNQQVISSASDATIGDLNNAVEEVSTSVLTQEEVNKIEEVSADMTAESTDIMAVLDSIASDSENAGDNIDKLGTLLESSSLSVEDWINLQNDLYVSVSDDLSVEAAALLESRNKKEAAKLQENVKSAEAKYAELKSAYYTGENEKVTYIAEDLSGMFNDEILSYGSEAADKAVNTKVTDNKNTQNLIRPRTNFLIDDPDEVSEYFEYEFETPLEAYAYIKNNVYTEFYYGRKKTVLGTYESCSGNDYDQAVLLASILNSMGYDTKYVRGNILLTPELALSMTGADNVEIAADIIAMAGVPTTKMLAKDGSIKSIKIEHVWVRAEIPYTDYRGTGNVSGDMVWVDLDTSIKLYEDAENIYDYLDNDAVYKELKTAFDIDGFDNGLELIKSTTENSAQRVCDEQKELYNRRRIIKKDNIGYLPLSLQYEVKDELEVAENIDIGDSVGISVSGEDLGTYSAAYLSDKSVIIAFDSASREDKEILDSYGNIFDVSASSVYVKPVLYIDGIKVAEAEYTEYSLGTPTKIGLSLYYSGTLSSKNIYIENNAVSGSTYALTIDDSVISNCEINKSYMNLYGKNNTVSENNVFTTEYLGALLAYSGKLYFAQLDSMDIIASETADVADIRCLSEAITGYEVGRKTLYGLVTKLSYGSLFIDVDFDDHAVVSRDGDKNKEIYYRFQIGSTGSMCEGLIWSEALHENKEETVSTISILGKAREQGIEVLTLNKDNLNDLSVLDNLELDQSEINRIKTDIESGKVISIPSENVTIGEWKGTGYISLDLSTGIATYKISGGLNGGFHPYAATGMMMIATIAEFLSAKLLVLALGSITFAGGIMPLMVLPAVALLVTGIVVTSMLLCYYIEYMIDHDDETFEGFIQWFMLSALVSSAQLQYVQFMIQIAELYGMYNVTQQQEQGMENENNKVSPSHDPDINAEPSGKPTVVNYNDPDKYNIRALEKENEAAKVLAKNGYVVEQNPIVPGSRNPDYLIEGEVFDCYTPQNLNSARGIASVIQGKIDNGQTNRIILNLSIWQKNGGNVDDIINQLNAWPIDGLIEVKIINQYNEVIDIYP